MQVTPALELYDNIVRAGLCALTYGEYLRDTLGKEVLFLMDNAHRETGPHGR